MAITRENDSISIHRIVYLYSLDKNPRMDYLKVMDGERGRRQGPLPKPTYMLSMEFAIIINLMVKFWTSK